MMSFLQLGESDATWILGEVICFLSCLYFYFSLEKKIYIVFLFFLFSLGILFIFI